MGQVHLATVGVWELLVILLIVVVIFGAGKLPQLGEGLGKAIRNFRRSYRDDPKEIQGEARRLDEGQPSDQLASGKSSGVEKNARTPSSADRK